MINISSGWATTSYREIYQQYVEEPLEELLIGTLSQGLVYGEVLASEVI